MKNLILILTILSSPSIGIGYTPLVTPPPEAPGPTVAPDEDPNGNAGALKAQVGTGCGYDAHSGNASRSVQDLQMPGALGVYGLDFTRHWNSLLNDFDDPAAPEPTDFGSSGWTHSWAWKANYFDDPDLVGGDGGPQAVYTTSITITFPDGHATKYKITRYNPNGRSGPPYTYAEVNWPDPNGGSVGDHLQRMASDGSEFWLYLADGGAVRFIGTSSTPPDPSGYRVWSYRATEVHDPHGLLTVLSYYPDGRLNQVQQDGGRLLTIRWDYYAGFLNPVIGRVSTGGSGASLGVDYHYNRFPDPNTGSFLVLTSVSYADDPAPNQTTSAVYAYELVGLDDSIGLQKVPMLTDANDRRFAGAMKHIQYDYRGSKCHIGDQPQVGPGRPANAPHDYFLAQPLAIAAEKSGGTGLPVSTLRIDCFAGTRQETTGTGARRMFFYGQSAGTQGEYTCFGYQLAKLTDFTNGDPAAANIPFERQNFLAGYPKQVWDGRSILTEYTIEDDGTGRVKDVWHRGSADNSHRTYDRTTTTGWETRDSTLLPNDRYHWLFNEKDENNFVTTYTRDSRRRIKRIDYPDTSFEAFTYNEFNQVLIHTLPSHATVTYVYDTRGVLQQESNSVDGPGAVKVYTYDAFDRVETVVDGRARANGKDFSTKMSYNSRHAITKVEYAGMLASTNNPSVTYVYDTNGDCLYITDELHHTTGYTYDEYGRCTSYSEPLNVPGWNAGATVASRTWEWYYDRLQFDGQYSASTHTSKNWGFQIEPVFDVTGERRMTVRYHDYNDHLLVEQTGWLYPNWAQGPDAEFHSYTYDANGNKENYWDSRGRQTNYTYDDRNRPWKTIEYFIPGDLTPPRTTETQYDPAGNKTLVKFPDTDRSVTQQWLYYDHFGQPRQFINERGKVTDINYWPWGPMKKQAEVVTHRDKDGGGTEDQHTNFIPDLLGRPAWTVFPDTTSEFTGYEFGQVSTFKTRKNQTKRVHYDARGREDSHTWDGNAAPAVSRTWDDASRMTTLSNIFSTIDYGYDWAGQVYYEGNTVAGSGGRAQTTYNRYPSGEVSQITYPFGRAFRRDYTGRGQLKTTGISDGNGNWVSQFVNYYYLADGKVNYQIYGNGVATVFGYDGRGMISSISHGGNGQALSYRDYWRDERDRIVAWKKSIYSPTNAMENGRGDHYYYDAEGQLTDAYYGAADPLNNPNNWGREDHFKYDALGNRWKSDYLASRGWLNFTLKDNGVNQYRTWGVWNTSYDDDLVGWGAPGAANGVLMQDGNITAGYNALNQPMFIQGTIYNGTQNWVNFGYDPLGRCVKRWVGPLNGSSQMPPNTNPATYFYYDGWNLIQEGSATSPIWRAGVGLVAGIGGADRAYVHGTRVDELVVSSTQATGTLAFHHYDARGHCTLLTDGSGNIMEQYEYDAFGQPYFYNAGGYNIGYSPWNNRFLFTGREWLSDLKLYDFRNRMYQPELGRFLQPDPKEFAAGDYNLYRYCHNDPVNKSDPTGLIEEEAEDKIEEEVESVEQRNQRELDRALHEPTAEEVAENKRELEAGTKTRGAIEASRTLRQIDANDGNALPGYSGGREFENDGRNGGEVLPSKDSSGNSITYMEHDVNPQREGFTRDAERLVLGSNGSAYYTRDHYTTFITLRE
jgi:RHS repeat-associated protein